MTIRVRFAPSPTGYLHVGGLRTALYNYLFAKNKGGACILRIEDTDRSRLVENSQENLIELLSWAGVEFDESPVVGGDYGPYVQSERLELYRECAKNLIDSGAAYYAFDTPEEIEAMRKKQQKQKKDPKYDRKNMRNSLTLSPDEIRKLADAETPTVVRLKVPAEAQIEFTDLIRGKIKVRGKDVDDQILMKSDGFPTYHLANVVDDHYMKISHVIRGEEWLPSTPKHVLLYEAFGWDLPEFAHLPLLLNKDKSKLSKRQDSVAVEDFRAKGYLKDAFVNFIALLGWNPTSNREIFTMNELIKSFNIEKVNKGGAVFNLDKLDWLNQQYLKKLDDKKIAKQLVDIMKENGKEISFDYATTMATLFKERVTFVREIPEVADYMFGKPQTYEAKYVKKAWHPGTENLLGELVERLKVVEDFSHNYLYNYVRGFIEDKGMKLKSIIHPIRLSITGKSFGAGMFETMEALGKAECIERMETFIEKARNEEI